MHSPHLSALEAKHATLDQKISVELQKPLPDDRVLRELKRMKLKVKEEIVAQ